MRRMRRILPILLALMLWPSLAAAQGGTVPPVPPPQPPQSRDTIPDLVGYVSFTVPVPDWLASWSCEAEPAGDWWNPAFQTQRLIWIIKQLFQRLFCLLISLMQFIANVIAGAINLVLVGINEVWRLLIFAWLTIRSWLLGLWYLFEVLRDWLQAVQGWLLQLSVWLTFLVEMMFAALVLLGQIVLTLISVGLGILGLLGWLAGLIIGLALDIIAALSGTTTPSQLSGTHPIYRYTRGLMDGVKDSAIGWSFWLLWAMAYVAWVAWLAKFLSASKEPA